MQSIFFSDFLQAVLSKAKKKQKREAKKSKKGSGLVGEEEEKRVGTRSYGQGRFAKNGVECFSLFAFIHCLTSLSALRE
jgi:hypothetical protein